MLVDGYNVIRAVGSKYSKLTDETPDHSQDAYNAAREALLGDVASFAGREFAATVVFDGAGNPGSKGEVTRFGTIEYLFSPHGVSADTIIEGLANKAVQEDKEVLVVSSDATLQWTVFSGKVVRMSALGFSEEVEALHKSLEDKKPPSLETPQTKTTLGKRIDPEVSKLLDRFVRGEITDFTGEK